MDPEPTNMCVAITVVAVSSIEKPGERKGRTLKEGHLRKTSILTPLLQTIWSYSVWHIPKGNAKDGL